MDSERQIPKIEVESKEDVPYIQNNILKAALEEVNKSLGPGCDAKLKETVTKLVKEWVDNTFKLATPNIIVNKINYKEAINEDEYEPFDEALYQDQVALKKRVDDLQVKLAERYKRVPQEIKLLMEGALKRQSAAAMDVEFTGLDDNGVDESELLEKEMPKRDQFVTKYRDIISTVNRLNNESLSKIAKLEQARDLVDACFESK
ncbi:11037_t:CDS:2 [Paraglomus brasilianum]|uniref:11037_t:CDS:1 n=1 Tax=Paraglomus brasilianum TaxID=144538 RepID=A0A9N9CAU7_9GLOM|nr:11037_t:CDS:2 [Paraglomus brasilianum]